MSIKILIWNNGRSLLNEEDLNNYLHKCEQKGISTEIYQDIRNLSLSKVYNYFINKKDYHFISVFDQDTHIENCFFQNIKNNIEHDIICPEVYLSNKDNIKSSPVYNKAQVNTEFVNVGEFNARSIFTCASGVTLSLGLINKISNKYGFVFNETYAFYWADHDLFERLIPFDFVKGLCIGKISHDMSGVGDEFAKMKETTKLEHGYGQILRRIYNAEKSGFLRNLIYSIKFSIKSKCSIISSIKIIQCVLFKAHPRSKKEINKNIEPTHRQNNYN
ncbi:glycosyl transferase [Pectobacterium brasiliense]|uniref:glycosyl transferase n=1 Tax=Pectobacterium brasiliense TaxID=180957 RepID=UPI000AA8C257|nr:glycosyl transferase [Pectobacterium brasiliense]MBN3191476.1 glycosyl transferase [Pectobacterium brasiliense]